MTPIDRTKAEAVAGKLTEAQRGVVKRAVPKDWECAYGLRAAISTPDALVKRGIFQRDGTRPGAIWSPATAIMYRLTPLGIAVRSILQESSS